MWHKCLKYYLSYHNYPEFTILEKNSQAFFFSLGKVFSFWLWQIFFGAVDDKGSSSNFRRQGSVFVYNQHQIFLNQLGFPNPRFQIFRFLDPRFLIFGFLYPRILVFGFLDPRFQISMIPSTALASTCPVLNNV